MVFTHWMQKHFEMMQTIITFSLLQKNKLQMKKSKHFLFYYGRFIFYWLNNIVCVFVVSIHLKYLLFILNDIKLFNNLFL